MWSTLPHLSTYIPTVPRWGALDLLYLPTYLPIYLQLVHPSQAAILVKAYFKSLRQCVKTEQMELKFEFLDILLQYDYVQINRKYVYLYLAT